MFSFNQNEILQEHQNGVQIIPKIEEIVDSICQKGYDKIFYIGIGGTALMAHQMENIVKQLHVPFPLYVEKAADFCLLGNPYFSSRSIVVIESISGDTPEMIQTADKVHDLGASILGYVEKAETPLYEKADYLIHTTGGAQYFWYAVTFRFLKNAGLYPAYDSFLSCLKAMPQNTVAILDQIDGAAKTYAEKYWNEPIQYLVASGNLEDWAYSYGMCTMEEMLWMRTRPISASDFFHGTLEVIDRDTCMMLIKGEDITRPLMERVECFVRRISAKITVFDMADFTLENIPEKYRGIFSPMIARTAFRKISAYLEYFRRHPLEIRRYYRHLKY